MDLIATLLLGVMGELACLSGLKFKTALRILLDVWGRVRMRRESEFIVASTDTASLHGLVYIKRCCRKRTYLKCSWKIASILSSKPDASASRFRDINVTWFGGIIERDTSDISPRCYMLAHDGTPVLRTYPWIRFGSCCLCHDYSLRKLDAAYSYASCSMIPYA